MSREMAAEHPRIVHALRGRLRVHLPAWTGGGGRQLEGRVRQVRGVLRVQANPTTSNVLIEFDPQVADQATLLSTLQAAQHESKGLPEDKPPPPALTERRGGTLRRADIAVRGLDRDPRVARKVVARLRSLPGVRAWANVLTGRVLVEYDAARVDLEEVIARVVQVELPDLPGEDRPAHPLDPAPLLQSVARTVGVVLGLGMLAYRRLRGGEPGAVRAAATAAGLIGLMRSFPTIRNGMRLLLGPNAADFLFSIAGIATLTAARSTLGLAVTGTEAVLLLRAVAARRAAWRRYEERLGGVATAEPGAVIRLEAGERAPLQAEVIEGTGSAIGDHGLPLQLAPGVHVPAGARLFGGPFVLQLTDGKPFLPQPRPAPLKPSFFSRYLQILGPVSLGYAAFTALRTLSLARTFEALLLVNPRTALIAAEAANLTAASRALRGGATIVGTRRDRVIRRPDVLLLHGPRVLADGLEVASIMPLSESPDAAELLALVGGISAAAGQPWGNAFPRGGNVRAEEGDFNGLWAAGTVEGLRYLLGPPQDPPRISEASQVLYQGGYLLELRLERAGEDEPPLGYVALRPRLSAGGAELVETCRRYGTRIELLPRGSPAVAKAVAHRAGVTAIESADPVEAIQKRQRDGDFVAFVSDSADDAPAFADCDLAIGLAPGPAGRFPARADVLAADLKAVAAIIESGGRRHAAVRDGVVLSMAANIAGAIWGVRGRPGIERASLINYITALIALVDDWARLRGGERRGATLAHLMDPHPERWGRRSIGDVLKALRTTENGLTSAHAAARRRQAPRKVRRHELLTALRTQMKTPTVTVLVGGAGLSLLLGNVLDAGILGATVVLNLVAGALQERQVGQAAEALQQMSRTTARVLRDDKPALVPAAEVVPGDVLLLAPGDRVPADARLLETAGLEVDEAALTGESLPVLKAPDAELDYQRIVLEGSDVVVGTGRAVAVAVGPGTRLGATAAALTLDETRTSPLGERLGQILRLSLPFAIGGGTLVIAAGLFRGYTLLSQLMLGMSTAISAVPEGLTLLAGAGQAGVARRLAKRKALVRRLAVVEALGRVDVACADKTGTLTAGRLAARLAADNDEEAGLPGVLGPGPRRVLLTAALACPHPDAADAAAHPTDIAVVRAAREAGLEAELRRTRHAEAAFDPARSFHASLVDGRLCLKGSPEALAPRCSRLRKAGSVLPLDAAGRLALLARARSFAERGLRVLLVAEGPADAPPGDPQQLTALGFVGISDPLRPTVPEAVRRCQEAGVHILMLTGDHPATARAIAAEAGLLVAGHDEVLTAHELAELHNSELGQRLEHTAVVARATPLDKLRIIEGLRSRGHTVAMTGDGVNDAPALRLADVGVAMGRSGTEVARQAADVVLADDDFATLVEALIEGRGFWQNMRRGLGLLLGGNLGELGLIVGASGLGFGAPLNTQQILVVNLITDALPALAVVLQEPEHRHLAGLAREGLTALDAGLRGDVLRRGLATALPALAAYLFLRRPAGSAEAGSVAFASIVTNQLAQTLDAGWVEGKLSGSVSGAVAVSAGLLAAALTVPPLRTLLGLTTPSPFGWTVIGGSALGAVALSRMLAFSGNSLPELAAAPARLGFRPNLAPEEA